jgi:hypothetical protein
MYEFKEVVVWFESEEVSGRAGKSYAGELRK